MTRRDCRRRSSRRGKKQGGANRLRSESATRRIRASVRPTDDLDCSTRSTPSGGTDAGANRRRYRDARRAGPAGAGKTACPRAVRSGWLPVSPAASNRAARGEGVGPMTRGIAGTRVPPRDGEGRIREAASAARWGADGSVGRVGRRRARDRGARVAEDGEALRPGRADTATVDEIDGGSNAGERGPPSGPATAGETTRLYK